MILLVCYVWVRAYAGVFLHKEVKDSRLGHIVITRCIKIFVCYGLQGEWWCLVVSFSCHYSMWQTHRIALKQRAVGWGKERVYIFKLLWSKTQCFKYVFFIIMTWSQKAILREAKQSYALCIDSDTVTLISNCQWSNKHISTNPIFKLNLNLGVNVN